MSKSQGDSAAELALLKVAMTYPGAEEHFPWGHRAIKVKGKAFLFMGTGEDGSFGLSCKLPHSGSAALTLPFAQPTEYGLGKSGWVSANFKKGEKVPVDLFPAWIDESYRAIAPKKLLAQLDGGAAPEKATAKAPVKKAPAKKPPAKRKTPTKKAAPAKRGKK